MLRNGRRSASIIRVDTILPVCPLWVFWVYKEVADSDDVVIQKQGLSTVGIRVPGIAMPLSP
jgi:hypothetical protein